MTKKELEKNTLKVALGNELSIEFVNEILFEYKFKRVDFVTEPGDFSVRGGIVDVFSFSHDEPYRIEFFGDEVDSIEPLMSKLNSLPSALKKLVLFQMLQINLLKKNVRVS